MRLLIPIFLITLIFHNCGTKYEAEIHEIDSLLVVMDSTRKTIKLVNGEMIRERHMYCIDRMNYLGSLTDTLGRKDAFLLDHFGGVCKAYRKWNEKFKNLEKHVEVVPQQLQNLRKDLSKNLIDSAEAAAYLKNEKEAVGSLHQTVADMERGLRSIEERYHEYDQKILLLIQKLESAQKEEIEA